MATTEYLHQTQPYNTAHGEVEVHGEVTHYAVDVPTDTLNHTEIDAYINGFGAFNKTSRRVSRATASLGDASLRWAPLRKSSRSTKEKLFDATRLHVDTLSAIADDLPNNSELKDLPNGNKLSMERLNLVPHSYGGDTAFQYTIAHPGNVANIIQIKTIGMEDANILRFLNRLPGSLCFEIIPYIISPNSGMSTTDSLRAMVHMLADPVQTSGEILACHIRDNRPLLPIIKSAGIGRALITGSRDRLINATAIEKGGAADLVDVYRKMDTDHLGPQNEPEKIAKAVVEVVDELDKAKLQSALGLTALA